jgi:hypothetical protein
MSGAKMPSDRNLLKRVDKEIAKESMRTHHQRKRRINEHDLHALLQFIIGISLCITLTGTVFAVLYSLIFVTQPVDVQAPNDREFFKLIAPIATFLTGTLSGIMLASKGHKNHGDD